MNGRITKAAVRLIERRVAEGEQYVAIARSVGVTSSTVRDIARGEHYHQQDAEEQARRLDSTKRHYLPSPEEISRACARFLSESPRDPVGYVPFEFTGAEYAV